MRDYFSEIGWPVAYLHEPIPDETEIIVVIPAYKEPQVQYTLRSLAESHDKSIPVRTIVVVNGRDDDDIEEIEMGKNAIATIEEMAPQLPFPVQIIFEPSLPAKTAGAGLARKIGMDEAARQFDRMGKNGIIAALDADCTVSSNYLNAILKHFRNSKIAAASIYYEHPLDGTDEVLVQGIIDYELHLRSYVQGLRYAGLPYAYHTVGSCMAIRSEDYVRQGGMNKRKAAEDFHFLQKFMQLYRFSDINDTIVFPSIRISDRVPFGTGRAQTEWSQGEERLTYSPESYCELKFLNDIMPQLYLDSASYRKLPDLLKKYLDHLQIGLNLKEIKANTSDLDGFSKRFFRWFNGLRCLQYFHFARDKGRADVSVMEAAQWIMIERWKKKGASESKDLLLQLRKCECDDVYNPL